MVSRVRAHVCLSNVCFGSLEKQKTAFILLLAYVRVCFGFDMAQMFLFAKIYSVCGLCTLHKIVCVYVYFHTR